MKACVALIGWSCPKLGGDTIICLFQTVDKGLCWYPQQKSFSFVIHGFFVIFFIKISIILNTSKISQCFFFHIANFFKFMHAKVSVTCIFTFCRPRNWVYLIACFGTSIYKCPDILVHIYILLPNPYNLPIRAELLLWFFPGFLYITQSTCSFYNFSGYFCIHGILLDSSLSIVVPDLLGICNNRHQLLLKYEKRSVQKYPYL